MQCPIRPLFTMFQAYRPSLKKSLSPSIGHPKMKEKSGLRPRSPKNIAKVMQRAPKGSHRDAHGGPRVSKIAVKSYRNSSTNRASVPVPPPRVPRVPPDPPKCRKSDADLRAPVHTLLKKFAMATPLTRHLRRSVRGDSRLT